MLKFTCFSNVGTANTNMFGLMKCLSNDQNHPFCAFWCLLDPLKSSGLPKPPEPLSPVPICAKFGHSQAASDDGNKICITIQEQGVLDILPWTELHMHLIVKTAKHNKIIQPIPNLLHLMQ